MTTNADVYNVPLQERFVDGQLQWDDDSVWFIRAQQRVTWDFTKRESLSLQFEYNDNDVRNRLDECFYESGDRDDDFSREVGCGEQWRVRAALASTRYKWLQARLFYVAGWRDTQPGAGQPAEVQFEHYARLSLRSRLWQNGQVIGTTKYWFQQSRDQTDDHLQATLSVQHRFAEIGLAVRVAYGVVGIDRSAGFDLSHFGAAQLDARFLGPD